MAGDWLGIFRNSDLRLVAGSSIGLAFGLPQAYFIGVIAVPAMEHFSVGVELFGAITGVMIAGIYLFSPVAGHFVDRFPRYGAAVSVGSGLALMGAALIAVGSMPEAGLWGFAALGLVGSMAVGMVYTISLSAVASRYRGARKGLATGISALGLGIGTTVGKLLVEATAGEAGVTAALSFMGCSALAAAVPAGLLMASVPPLTVTARPLARAKPQSPLSILLTGSGVKLCAAFVLTSPLLLIAFSHIGVEVANELNGETAALVVSLLALAGLPGRVLAGVLSDRYGPRVCENPNFRYCAANGRSSHVGFHRRC